MPHAIKFALVSFGLHAIVLAMLRPDLMFDAVGFGASSNPASTVMAVEIHPSKEPTEASSVNSVSGKSHHIEQHRKTDPKQSAALSTEEKIQVRRSEKANAGIASSSHDFIATGLLTRMPVPITNIDLDVAEVKDVVATGAVSLAILIDADGSVIDVVSMNADSSLKHFADRVAEVFRRARFSPGEINGKAVKTRLEINVVSEPLVSL